MNSKERFASAISHRQPDRVPIDYLATPSADKKLKMFYNIDNEIDLLDILGCDFYYLPCRDISQNESCRQIYHGPELVMDARQRICPFGIKFNRGAYDSKFAVDEAIQGPLENASSEADILHYNWPKIDWFDFDTFHNDCEQNSNRVIIGGFWSGILGDCYRMHGFENFLFNIAMKPSLIKTLISRMTDFYLAVNEKLFSQFKGKINIWFFGNDFGSQSALLFSEQMFCEFFLPDITRLVKLAKSYGLHVMMHSCGSIRQIIPLLIEAGIDILDPIQTTASGMEPESLKSDYGNKIVFHGAIDTQNVLPFSSADKVFEYSRTMINTLGKSGGYIFAPSQVLQGDIPVENIDAMYRAARLV